ncbi:hypothetical protein V492_06270 [Pseudogymnoascus sp. VKM F-4246]|nr:hypothetical protein V492_06270 [Pseudogymnoascus sp. VKM F-4246]
MAGSELKASVPLDVVGGGSSVGTGTEKVRVGVVVILGRNLIRRPGEHPAESFSTKQPSTKQPSTKQPLAETELQALRLWSPEVLDNAKGRQAGHWSLRSRMMMLLRRRILLVKRTTARARPYKGTGNKDSTVMSFDSATTWISAIT